MLFTASFSVCAELVNIFIDKVVAARFLGENALAAISFFTPMFSFILFLSAMVMVGSLVCYSIELGRLNKHRADRFFGQGIILSFAVGILMVQQSMILIPFSWAWRIRLIDSSSSCRPSHSPPKPTSLTIRFVLPSLLIFTVYHLVVLFARIDTSTIAYFRANCHPLAGDGQGRLIRNIAR
ncbi:MAG: hypothetical protein IKO07_08875 [Clostridia bacterium]|nr:hypothetical protein [Clostridia bacterium]